MYTIEQAQKASASLAREGGIAAEGHQQIANWLEELQGYRNNETYMSPAAEQEWNKMVTGLWVIFTMNLMLGAWNVILFLML
jgi:hypothetical protein